MKLNRKVVVVTDGSDGIGTHICLKLAAEDRRLAILGRDASRLNMVCKTAVSEAAAEEPAMPWI